MQGFPSTKAGWLKPPATILSRFSQIVGRLIVILIAEEVAVPNRLRGKCFQAKSYISANITVRQDHWGDNCLLVWNSMGRVIVGNHIDTCMRGRDAGRKVGRRFGTWHACNNSIVGDNCKVKKSKGLWSNRALALPLCRALQAMVVQDSGDGDSQVLRRAGSAAARGRVMRMPRGRAREGRDCRA